MLGSWPIIFLGFLNYFQALCEVVVKYLKGNQCVSLERAGLCEGSVWWHLLGLPEMILRSC